MGRANEKGEACDLSNGLPDKGDPAQNEETKDGDSPPKEEGFMRLRPYVLAACLLAAGVVSAAAQPVRWATSWTGSVQGPYPVGNPSAQPDMHFAFPSAETGARDQTLRLMVMPSLWGQQIRLRFSNALGTRPVTFDGVFAGLQRSGSVLEPGSNQPVAFAGRPTVTISPGQSVWSDPIPLPF